MQEISVSQYTIAYHCQIKNSSPVEVDIAGSIGRGCYSPLIVMSTKMLKKNTTFLALLSRGVASFARSGGAKLKSGGQSFFIILDLD